MQAIRGHLIEMKTEINDGRCIINNKTSFFIGEGYTYFSIHIIIIEHEQHNVSCLQ